MLLKYCYVTLLIVAVKFRQSGCANISQELDPGVDGASGRSIANDGVKRIEEAPSKDDMWKMVASMRDTGGGSSRLASTIKPHSSGHIGLDWSIGLDALGHYQLSWHANVSSNEIVFALNIDTNKTNFHTGTDIFALGFSERGQLNSSDFCLIWFDLSHRLHLQDAITDSDNTLQLIDSAESACRLLDSNTGQISRQNLADHLFAGGERARTRANSRQLGDQDSMDASKESLEIVFSRPLEVCRASANRASKRWKSYYFIDSGTTHLIWFTLKGPLLALDGLNLSETLQTSKESQGTSKQRYADSGMRRVQLIATKPSSSDSSSNDLADAPQPQASSVKAFDVLMDKYKIPAKETTYLCKLVKLPSKFQSRRYHITSYEAVIEPGNEHVVHHMELFNCVTSSQGDQADLDNLYASGGWSGECSSPDRPRSTESCKRVILAWAMGAKPLVYPEQVGQSIGGPDYGAYVMLEVHYNNVAQSSGLVDSSGLRFQYSARLRPFDAGVLEVGLEYTDKNSIPPGMVTPLAGYCVSECTRAAMSAPSGETDLEEADYSRQDVARNGLDYQQLAQHHRGRHRRRHRARGRHGRRGFSGPDEDEADSGAGKDKSTLEQQPVGRALEAAGIYVFAAQMHTHLTGVASWTEHVREGRLVGELQRDNHYSPHFQEIRLLPRPVHIAPGDALIHYCLYDTRQRANVTLGGYATTDEMCVTYLHYYPKIDLEVCKSSVETAALSDYFVYLARDEGQPTGALLVERDGPATLATGTGRELLGERSSPAVKSVSENYHSIEWSRRRSRELIEFYNKAPLSVQCNRSDGRRWPGHWNGVMPTQIVDSHRREDGDEDQEEEDEAQTSDTIESLAGPRRKSARQLVDYRGLGATAKALSTQCRRQAARYPDYDFL